MNMTPEEQIMWHDAVECIEESDHKKLRTIILSQLPADSNYEGWNLVHKALLTKSHIEVIRTLIELNVPINTKTPLGTTPLDIAINNDYKDAVKELIIGGADITAIGHGGKSCLDRCSEQFFEKTHPGIINVVHNALTERAYKTGKVEEKLSKYLENNKQLKDTIEQQAKEGKRAIIMQQTTAQKNELDLTQKLQYQSPPPPKNLSYYLTNTLQKIKSPFHKKKSSSYEKSPLLLKEDDSYGTEHSHSYNERSFKVGVKVPGLGGASIGIDRRCTTYGHSVNTEEHYSSNKVVDNNKESQPCNTTLYSYGAEHSHSYNERSFKLGVKVPGLGGASIGIDRRCTTYGHSVNTEEHYSSNKVVDNNKESQPCNTTLLGDESQKSLHHKNKISRRDNLTPYKTPTPAP